jgi:hypothetical protein
MAAVMIDIPGIGQVEAKNAASDATLKEILKALGGGGPRRPGPPGPGGGGGNTGGGGGGNAGGGGGGSGPGAMTKMASGVGKAFGTLVGTTGTVIGGLDRMSSAVTNTIKQFANVGNDLNSAANIFSSIPIVGTMFTAVAGAATSVAKSFNEVSKSGATFGGSISSFSAAASRAGMTMEQFGSLIANNGEAMLGLGSNVEAGAKRFGDVSKALRATGSDLYALGYSTQDINQGLANYTKNLRNSGRQGTQSNAELAQGAKNYLKEMDALAKVTGESRADKEKERERLIKDGQFAAAQQGLNKDVADSMLNMVQSMPSQGLKDFAKDVLSSGSATTESSRQLAAAYPELYAQLQRQHQQTQSNIKISDQERNQTLNNMKAEAKSTMDRNKTAYRSNSEMAAVSADVAAGMRINTDATKDAAAAQDDAAKNTDKLNEKVNKSQEALAAFSNSFQMALANSGLLDLLMRAFEFTAGLVMKYLVPAFNIMAAVVTTVGGILLDTLEPAFAALGVFLENTVMPAFLAVADFVLIDLLPALQGAWENLYNFFEPALTMIGGLIRDYVWPAFKSLTLFVLDNVVPILKTLAVALGIYYGIQMAMALPALLAQIPPMLALAAAVIAVTWPVIAVTAAIAALVFGVVKLFDYFKRLGGDVEVVGNVFKYVGLMMKGLWISLKEGIFGLLNKIPGMRGDFDKDLQDIQEEKTANEKEKSDLVTATAERMKANKDKIIADEKAEAAKAAADAKAKEDKRAALHAGLDAKNLKSKAGFNKQQEDSNKKAKDALDAKAAQESAGLNLTGSTEDLLKGFAAREGSALIPDKPATTEKANTAVAAAVSDAEKKKQEAEAKAKTDAETKAKEEAASKEKQEQDKKSQESPSTLLAELNTKMAQLIKLQAQTTTNTYENVMATKGLNKNLYKA